MTDLTKTCSKCSVEKNLGAFSPNKGGKHGRKSVCKACTAGGQVERYSRDKAAAAAAARAWRAANTDKVREHLRKYRTENHQKRMEYKDAYTKANPEKAARWRANQYQKNREERIAAAVQWQRDNPDKVNARTARRRAAKLKATPPWVDHDTITAVYIEAAKLTLETGIPHDVDHIVPLQGKTVCGLHVPWNLRAIPAHENRRKSNKLLS